MAGSGEQGVVRVRIDSPDGKWTHPFKRTDTIAEVRERAYGQLVQNKTAVPLSATSIQFGGNPVADSEKLGTLATGGKNHGNEIDLVLSLVWTSQGGGPAPLDRSR